MVPYTLLWGIQKMPEEKILESVYELDPKDIRPMPNQPRTDFDSEETIAHIKGIAESIARNGQFEPVWIRVLLEKERTDKRKYQLVDGECRLRACLLGNLSIQAVIKNKSTKGVEGITDKKERDLRLFELSVESNTHRKGLSVQDTIRSVKIMRDGGRDVEYIGKIHGGKTKAWVYQYINLGSLPEEVLTLMGPAVSEEKRVTPTSAMALFQLPKEVQVEIAYRASNEGLSTMELRALVSRTTQEKGIVTKKGPRTNDNVEKLFTLRRVIEQRVTLAKLEITPKMLGVLGPQKVQVLVGDLRKSIDDLKSLEAILLQKPEVKKK